MKKISSDLYQTIRKIVLFLTLIFSAFLIYSWFIDGISIPGTLVLIFFSILWIMDFRNSNEVYISETQLKVDGKLINFSDLISIQKSGILNDPKYKVLYFENKNYKSFTFVAERSIFEPFAKPNCVIELEKIIDALPQRNVF